MIFFVLKTRLDWFCWTRSRSKYSAPACLTVEDNSLIALQWSWSILFAMCLDRTETLQQCFVSLKDKRKIRESWDCFGILTRLRHVHLFVFVLIFLVNRFFDCIIRINVYSIIWSPAIFPPVSSSIQLLHVLSSGLSAQVSFWIWCSSLSFHLSFLRESTCIRTSSALVPFPADTIGFAPHFREEWHNCSKAVRRASPSLALAVFCSRDTTCCSSRPASTQKLSAHVAVLSGVVAPVTSCRLESRYPHATTCQKSSFQEKCDSACCPEPERLEVVWCGVVWCDVVWCGVEWLGVL